MDKEFAEAFKEEIELDEMKFVAGGFYHQEFKNGDALYFRADSLQKDGTWNGRWVNATRGKIDSKKAQKASVNPKMKTKGAEHGEPHWETTPKNKIPKMFNNAPVVEEIELDEMKWEAGVVYHQEFKNGDKVYFRADSVQKNKRWKGLSVDEFGGRQKKAKSASADEKQQGWVTTPKN